MKPLLPPASMANANTYGDLNGLAALKRNPSSPQAFHAVAQQIDALFLQMMLKSMRDAGASIGEADSNEMGMYQDMFDKQIALSMSQSHPLGLGAQLTRQLAAQAGAAVPPGTVPPARAADGVPPATSVTPAEEPVAPAEEPATAADFVGRVFPAIRRAALALGVNPFAMLAQAVLETGWGKRMARGADGIPSHNVFGIKAGDAWSGPRMSAETIEFTGGVATRCHTAFRAYGSVEDSVTDFARLLGSSPRYHEAIAAGGDATAYVAAIGRSGYATDPGYANKLSEIMSSSKFRGAVLAHAALTL